MRAAIADRRCLWIVLAVSLSGCAGSKDRIPATPTQDPLLQSPPVGRPTSTVAPAPKGVVGEQTANPPASSGGGAAAGASGGGVEANTTSRTKAEPGAKRPPSATLMAPAETLSQSPASLAMQSAAKSVGVQQAQWQAQAPQNSLEQALQRLQGLGALEQRLELRGGQWTFTCDGPSPTNPQARRRYEGADATPLGAVRSVLDKLEAQSR